MNLRSLLRGASGALASLLQPLSAAEVSPTDPVPNTPATPGPADGGIGYRWTVRMAERDRAMIDGTVGAWSWDEDGFPESARGWTHTSAWVALELREDARLTVRIERKAGVPTAVNQSNPDGVGFFNLFPAFTIYRGWQESGGDQHNFNNRGNVAWAADIAHLVHYENQGGHVIEATIPLEAGLYSLVLGGNSPSTLAEGRQGYGAMLSTKPYHDPVGITLTREKRTTRRSSFELRGGLVNAKAVAAVEVKHGGRTLAARVRGSSWRARVSGLKPGRNLVHVKAVSVDGSASRPSPVVIMRHVERKMRHPLFGIVPGHPSARSGKPPLRP